MRLLLRGNSLPGKSKQKQKRMRAVHNNEGPISFEPAMAIERYMTELCQATEHFGKLSQEAEKALESIRAFKDQAAKLADSFAPVREFQRQLADLAQAFEPMRDLCGQLSHTARTFHSHLLWLSNALAPAHQLHERFSALAKNMGDVGELHREFEGLADNLRRMIE